MVRVLAVGLEPAEVDFSDPALPRGMDGEMMEKAIREGLRELAAIGHTAEHLFISSDTARLGPLAERLSRGGLDCVLIGGGVRLPARNLRLFEAVLNMVARAKPPPRIALVVQPGEWAEAVHRALSG